MLLPTVLREVAPSAEQLQAAETRGSDIMSPTMKAEFLERIQQQMNDIAHVLNKKAQYFVLSGSYFTLVLKDFLVSKQWITGDQAVKLSTLKADDVDAFWSEQSLDEDFKMDWKKNNHKQGAKSLASNQSPRQVNSVYSKPFSLLKLVNGFDINAVMGGVSATIAVTEQAQPQQALQSQQSQPPQQPPQQQQQPPASGGKKGKSKKAQIEDVYVSRELWYFLLVDATFRIHVPAGKTVSAQSFVRLMYKGFQHPALGLDIGTFDTVSHISNVQTSMDLRILRKSHKEKVEKMLGWKDSPIGQVKLKPTGLEKDKDVKGNATAWVLVP